MSRADSNGGVTAGESMGQSIYLVEHHAGVGQITYKRISYCSPILPQRNPSKFPWQDEYEDIPYGIVVTENRKQSGISGK